MANRFLTELHGRFGAPRHVVVGLAERATGRRVGEVERVVRGYDNEVYRVGLDGGAVVYPRIRPAGDRGQPDEVWAMKRARAAGVPVPDVLASEVVDTEEGEREAMVVASAPGRELAKLLPSLTRNERRSAMAAVGRVLALLHSAPMPGPWRPDGEGRWPDPTSLRDGFIDDRAGERAELVQAGLTDEEVDQIIGLLPTAWDATASEQPVLCHGDLSPDHVFVDSGLRVSAVIDWGGWHGGAAIGDLARASMLNANEDFAAIVRGYGRWAVDDPEFRRALALSTMMLTIGHTAHHVRIGDIAGAPRSVARLRRILAEFNRGGLAPPRA